MSNDTLALLGFMALVAGIFGLNLWDYWRAYGSLPTFDEYGEQHPGLVKDGRCRCHKCGGGRLFLHSFDSYRRRHVCATCGTVLFRS
jgi:hypothetical protein